MVALAALGRSIRTRRGLLVLVPAVVAVLIGALVVPLAVTGQCRLFGSGCGIPRIRFVPPPTRLTGLQAALRGGYVALGDSYSSGEGTWDLTADRGYAGGGAQDCHRSQGSYFATVLRGFRFALGGTLWACSGARIDDVLHGGRYGEPAQIDRLRPDTSLVTLTIGGNDIGFSEIVTRCVVRLPWSSACRDQDAGIRARMAAVPAGLASVFDQIGRRAPNARIVVLGYPRPFPVRPGRSVDNIGVADQVYLNGVVRALDDVIADAARRADGELAAAGRPGTVEFADGYAAFDGHELGTAQPYLNPLKIDFGALAAEPRSFHPNQLGYGAFAQLIDRQIQSGPARPVYQYRR
ncbi:SGNH/GDSL hydrolase family protein [Actinoallomurus sp. NPDC052308]|uniref:SGNH/GDSL hydrolase family protein n=1 Tax=Actinoallomurus sp. NPDC052308 TaxID=3155530 RepID=UPI00342E19BC